MPEADFQRIQREFAAHIRDPARQPAPADVAPRRMATYRELFFNNIENFIATGFPVLQSILAGERWTALVEDFYARHRCQTPLFVEIAQEFLAYLGAERGPRPDDPPFMPELAHYEWVELALAVAEAEVPPLAPEFETNPLAHTLRLSELAWPLAYGYPVHLIGPDHQPTEPPARPTCLVVYRDAEDAVRFTEVNPATYRLLTLLEENGPTPAVDCLTRLAEELRHPDPAAVLAFGAEILRDLGRRGVVGTVDA
ncbi:hypothetical protein SAMN02949497_2947 [Methylomagnum ishizawai]|uniref:Uncharacterized protein n=1 Tax=Methylomagnum ishizawai TaxID=1760988 RepID=A0A1Y6D4X7_9GAMM|nr:putative DNA-binding domain-containing protein [Methylomagnum ishizawai]SMF95582.1 hypothetical protein SAMN02949497_2947 [Methylomagnum ishizawai]